MKKIAALMVGLQTLTALSLVFSTGCMRTRSKAQAQTTPTVVQQPEPAGAPMILPNQDARVALTDFEQEPKSAAMHTYVLFSRDVSVSEDNDLKRRCAILLHEVCGVIPAARPEEDLTTANVFYIPTKAGTATPVYEMGITDYNFELSIRCLDKFRSAITNRNIGTRLRTKPGPFLISSLVPITRMTGTNYLLCADLSNINTNVIPLVVQEYRKRVDSRFIDGNEVFGSFRVSFFNTLVNANDSFCIATTLLPPLLKSLKVSQ